MGIERKTKVNVHRHYDRLHRTPIINQIANYNNKS